jgi:hypothetical protein
MSTTEHAWMRMRACMWEDSRNTVQTRVIYVRTYVYVYVYEYTYVRKLFHFLFLNSYIIYVLIMYLRIILIAQVSESIMMACIHRIAYMHIYVYIYTYTHTPMIVIDQPFNIYILALDALRAYAC